MNEQTPPVPAQSKGRGCFFYGCLTVFIVTLLLGVGAYLAIRSAVNSFVGKYADTKPMTLPKVELSTTEMDVLDKRLQAFKDAMSTNGPVQPLTLTATDINALINKNADLKDKFYLGIENDQFKARVSIPLEDLRVPLFRSLLKGRYLNGTADLKASLLNGALVVSLQSVEVNGRTLPADVLSGLRNRNLVEGMTNDPKVAATLNNLQSIQTKDGVVTIEPRKAPKTPEAEAPTPTPR